jgi:SpoVK/Ycf46/Vps4 family AAA+-type ATPase
LIAATFSLAHKLQPAVIFIDELDTFLKNSNSETAYMDSIKAEFLTLWDGVATASKSRVLVLGATNKPQHIDPAILRRMPRAFEVPLPNDAGRLAILELLLKDENVDETVKAALPKLAAATNGYSGSDLKELCKAAAMVSVQERTAEFARRRVMGEADTEKTDVTTKIRAITQMDLIAGLRKVRRTGEAAHRYGKEFEREQQHEEGPNIDLRSLQNLAAVLRSLSSLDKDIGDEIPNLR